MSDRQKSAAGERLAAAGIGKAGGGGGDGWPAESESRLRDELRSVGDQMLDGGRVVDLAAMLCKLGLDLDKLSWRTWREVAPRSQIRRRSELGQTIAKFVTGDEQTPRVVLEQDLEMLRALTAGLISSLSQVGHFAYQKFDRLSPREIETLVSAGGGGGLFKGKEAACWQKYSELAAELDEAMFEAEVRGKAAEYAESIIRGRAQ